MAVVIIRSAIVKCMMCGEVGIEGHCKVVVIVVVLEVLVLVLVMVNMVGKTRIPKTNSYTTTITNTTNTTTMHKIK